MDVVLLGRGRSRGSCQVLRQVGMVKTTELGCRSRLEEEGETMLQTAMTGVDCAPGNVCRFYYVFYLS